MKKANYMEKFMIFVLSALGVAVAAVLLPLIMPLFGAFAGAVIGFFFDETSREFLNALGMQKLEMWQLGAMLGFVGGFFKASTVKA
jgi:hypothetical protein